MKLVESGPSCPKSRQTSVCASAPIAVPSSPSRIHGFGDEDSWETFALAKYRAYTTSEYAIRLSNSEPDLVHRRPTGDAFAKRQHRRSATMPKRDAQPWVCTGNHATRDLPATKKGNA